MSSERKTITINPALFTVGGTNTTKKKRPAAEPKDLKIKTTPLSHHNTKTLRNRLLHYIRKNQEDNFKKIHGKSEITVPTDKRMHITETFNNDFEESLKYMKEIADKVDHTVDNNRLMNQTLRNYKSLNPESVLSGMGFENTIDTPSIDIPVFTDLPPISSMSDTVKIRPSNQPQWGCIKSGKLPTYRMWKNQTQHSREPANHGGIFIPPVQSQMPSLSPAATMSEPLNLGNMPISAISSLGASSAYGGGNTPKEISVISPPMSIREEPKIKLPPKPDILHMNQIREKTRIAEEAKAKSAIKYGKRKKTIRRTYKLGKSRVNPKVAVLISNKTVRKNISSKTEKLKQIPIEEIRTVLIKKGFIKVGSLATNDVLRKMYESMLLVCGEVENHNPDNLVYNYFNSA